MTRTTFLTLALLIGAPAAAAAQAHDHSQQSEHSGKESREIKALAGEEIAALLAGEGMGLALAAELNRYPGPRHVLDLADALKLTPVQREQVRGTFQSMQRQAIDLGRQIVEQERQLDHMFAARHIDDARLTEATSALGRLQGELRRVHLAAHLRTTAVLTDAQVKEYDVLRGYEVR
jgi:Spy/CpxP family protein refolding chaperone